MTQNLRDCWWGAEFSVLRVWGVFGPMCKGTKTRLQSLCSLFLHRIHDPHHRCCNNLGYLFLQEMAGFGLGDG